MSNNGNFHLPAQFYKPVSQRDPIVITEGRYRQLHMGQEGDDLVLDNWVYSGSPQETQHFNELKLCRNTARLSPEELALVVLSASGRFQERFSAELERLQGVGL